MNKPIPSLYALKAICAAGVVYLHSWYANEYIFLFSKLAVPIFFAISGYFLFLQDSFFENVKILHAIKKTIKLILWSNFLYLIYWAILWGAGETPITIDSPVFFLTWLFLGGNISPPLWYLTAYVEALVAIFVLVKVLRLGNFLFIIAMICYFLSLILGRYSFLFDFTIPKDWIYTNFLVLGIPFIVLGMYVKKYEGILVKHGWLVLTISLLAFWVEIKLYQNVASFGGKGYTGITSFALVSAILIICLKYRNVVSEHNLLTIVGKTYSLQIYVLHYLFLSLCLIYKNQICLSPSAIFAISFTMPILLTKSYYVIKSLTCKNGK